MSPLYINLYDRTICWYYFDSKLLNQSECRYVNSPSINFLVHKKIGQVVGAYPSFIYLALLLSIMARL